MIRKGMYCLLICLFLLTGQAYGESYPIVDTGQSACFNNSKQIGCADPGDDFNGQDAQYKGKGPKYRDNGDGTVTDLVTGLMWVKARGEKMTWSQAMQGATSCNVGGYSDWRAPTIKELYSLIDFNGWGQPTESGSTPFIDARYFDFKYGNTNKGERIIDCQDWSSTLYVSKTMGGNKTAFGVNFADGRIKGYGTSMPGGRTVGKYIRYVRGNPLYGKNSFVDRKNGTIEDKATGLTWQQKDDGKTRNWEQALSYCENLNLGGRSDWRLPSAKELQSIVDYTRSPKTTNSAAIDPKFFTTDKEGWFWSSTTHMDGPRPKNAVYVAFGRAMGYFAPPKGNASKKYTDVHGAGAQRSDPKSGKPASGGHGPQGDEQRVNNFVRCVTGGGVEYYEPPYKRIPSWTGGKMSPGGGQDFNKPQSQGMQGGSPMGMQGGHGQGMQRGQGMGMQGGQQMQGPPREAYEACSNVPDGGDCSFQAPHGTVTGMCRDMGGNVICVPEQGPGGGRMGGPPMQ